MLMSCLPQRISGGNQIPLLITSFFEIVQIAYTGKEKTEVHFVQNGLICLLVLMCSSTTLPLLRMGLSRGGASNDVQLQLR